MRGILWVVCGLVLLYGFGLLGSNEVDGLKHEECLNATPVNEWAVSCKM